MANDGLKHVVHRRVHLERSQPEYRKRKVGQYLEKKSDYKRRAERYHVREKIIKELSSKTRFRNEDEFSYKMIHGRIGDEGQVILESEESAKKRKLTKKAQVKSDLNNIDRNLFVLNHKQNVVKKKLEKLIGSNPAVVKSGKPKQILFNLDDEFNDKGNKVKNNSYDKNDDNNDNDDNDKHVYSYGSKRLTLNDVLSTNTKDSKDDTSDIDDVDDVDDTNDLDNKNSKNKKNTKSNTSTESTKLTNSTNSRSLRSSESSTDKVKISKTSKTSKTSKKNKKSNKYISTNVCVSDIKQNVDELFKLSDTFDRNRELEIIRNKLEDRRNLTIAKYKKRQVKRVRNNNSSKNTNTNVRVHKFVTQRLK